MFEGDLESLSTADLLESAAEHRAEANRSDARLLEHAQIYADRQQAYQEQAAPTYAPPAAPPPPPPSGESDMITQLKQLGELHDQGIVTDDAFAAQKAKVLGT